MKLFAQILLFCVLLSVIKALMVLVAVAIVLMFVWGTFYRTSETVGLIAFSLLIEALQFHPFVTIGAIMVVCAAVWLAPVEPRDKPSPSPSEPVALLPPPSAPAG
jgi:hypothetical protein